MWYQSFERRQRTHFFFFVFFFTKYWSAVHWIHNGNWISKQKNLLIESFWFLIFIISNDFFLLHHTWLNTVVERVKELKHFIHKIASSLIWMLIFSYLSFLFCSIKRFKVQALLHRNSISFLFDIWFCCFFFCVYFLLSKMLQIYV